MNLGTLLRPLTIGASIGNLAGSSGTLGAFVKTPDGIGILSAGYVLAPTSLAKKGDWIHQPGGTDIESLTPRTRIATLYDWTKLSRLDFPNALDSPNMVDAGVALLTDEIEHLGNLIPSGLGCPVEGHILKEIADVKEIAMSGMRVGKIGRGTGYTEGFVDTVSLSANIYYETRISHFNNLFVVETEEIPFGNGGDGGAIIFTLDPDAPPMVVGLLIAGATISKGQHISYACPIKSVLETLKVELI